MYETEIVSFKTCSKHLDSFYKMELDFPDRLESEKNLHFQSNTSELDPSYRRRKLFGVLER